MLRVGHRPLMLARRHGHGAGGHSHTTQLLSGKGAAMRVTWAGLICNAGMALGKGVGGYVFHSQALIADAVHAVSDLGSDFLTLATINFVKRPPSRHFPDGYGKVESMGAFGVNALLVYAGVSMGWTGVVSVVENLFGHSQLVEWMSLIGHHHSHGGDIADWNAAWIALASIFVKEALFRVTHRVGVRENSPVLIANAWHHRADCYASIIALLAISSGQIFNAVWMDAVGAVIVSGAIFHAGWGPLKSSFAQLIGNSSMLMNSPTFEKINTAAHSSIQSIDPTLQIEDLQLRPFGPSYVASLKLRGPPTTSLAQLQHAAEQLKQDLKAADGNLKSVHVNL